MYEKCDSLLDARRVFDRMELHDVVSWTARILGKSKNGEFHQALELFESMINTGCSPNAKTFVAALVACAGSALEEEKEAGNKRRYLEKGMKLHSFAHRFNFQRDIFMEPEETSELSDSGSSLIALRARPPPFPTSAWLRFSILENHEKTLKKLGKNFDLQRGRTRGAWGLADELSPELLAALDHQLVQSFLEPAGSFILWRWSSRGGDNGGPENLFILAFFRQPEPRLGDGGVLFRAPGFNLGVAGVFTGGEVEVFIAAEWSFTPLRDQTLGMNRAPVFPLG